MEIFLYHCSSETYFSPFSVSGAPKTSVVAFYYFLIFHSFFLFYASLLLLLYFPLFYVSVLFWVLSSE